MLVQRNTPGILQAMQSFGFPQIAQIWQPFLEEGCAVYVMAARKLRIRDDFALHLVSRLFPATEPENLELIPILPSSYVSQITDKNIIILGRIHSFQSKEFAAALTAPVHKYANFRFIDNQIIIDLEHGNHWIRFEEDELKIGYGIFRFWQQEERFIINFCGAGAIGTLAATMTLTQFTKPPMMELEQVLAKINTPKDYFLEVLVKGEWEAINPTDILSPASINVKVLRTHIAQSEKPRRMPWLRFKYAHIDGEEHYEVYIGVPGIGENIFSDNSTKVAILAALARRTEQIPSTSIEMGGYLTYQQIAEDPLIKRICGFVSQDAIRAIVSRIRQVMELPKWRAICPGLLLQGAEDTRFSRGRKKQVFRLRATVQWDPPEWWEL